MLRSLENLKGSSYNICYGESRRRSRSVDACGDGAAMGEARWRPPWQWHGG